MNGHLQYNNNSPIDDIERHARKRQQDIAVLNFMAIGLIFGAICAGIVAWAEVGQTFFVHERLLIRPTTAGMTIIASPMILWMIGIVCKIEKWPTWTMVAFFCFMNCTLGAGLATVFKSYGEADTALALLCAVASLMGLGLSFYTTMKPTSVIGSLVVMIVTGLAMVLIFAMFGVNKPATLMGIFAVLVISTLFSFQRKQIGSKYEIDDSSHRQIILDSLRIYCGRLR